MEKFELSQIQAQAILDMRLQRLTALEADKVRAEHAELMETIAELRAILGDPARIDAIIDEELAEIVESATATSGGPRSRTSRATSTSRT